MIKTPREEESESGSLVTIRLELLLLLLGAFWTFWTFWMFFAISLNVIINNENEKCRDRISRLNYGHIFQGSK